MNASPTMPDPRPKTDSTLRCGAFRHAAARAPSDLLRVSRWELRRLVERVCRDTSPTTAIDPTTLVNEVARRMLGASGAQDLPSRSDFYADLAQSLRRMLRQETATGFSQTASLALTPLELDQPARPAVLSGVLDRLEEKSSRHAQIVILRLLGGMTTAEIAEQMGLPAARIATGWETAREWLLRWLAHQDQTETTLPPQA